MHEKPWSKEGALIKEHCKSHPSLSDYSSGFLFRGALSKAACCTPKGRPRPPWGHTWPRTRRTGLDTKQISCNTHFPSGQASHWLSWTTSLAVAYHFAVGYSEPGSARLETSEIILEIPLVPDTAMRVWLFEEADETVCI